MASRRSSPIRAQWHAVLAAAALSAAIGCGGEGERPREAPAAMAGSGLTPEEMTDEGVTFDETGRFLLDDLNDSDAHFESQGISGEWFTYSDGTSTLAPPDHTGLPAVDGEAHVTGQGFSEWGAGLSAYFRSVDLSQFLGVRITARGAGTVVVELATPATSPPNEGGTCMGTGCFGHFATTIQLTAEHQEFTLPFAMLTQPTWAQPANLALDGVISINLVAKLAGGSANIDLWVDRLELYIVEVP